MIIINLLLWLAWIVLLFAIMFFIFNKAEYHLRYFKKVYPEKFSSIDSYLGLMTTPWEVDFGLLFDIQIPFFRPEKTEVRDEELDLLKHQITSNLKALYISFALMLGCFILILLLGFLTQ